MTHNAYPDTPVPLGTLVPTKDGSQKRVKDTGELAKMVYPSIAQGGLGMRSRRKFQAEHLNWGGLKERRERSMKSAVRGEGGQADGAAG